MSLFGIIYLVLLAILISALFSYGLKIKGPWGNFWAFFLIILLSVFAVDVWFPASGPYFFDIYWFPPLLVGLIIALLLAAATPIPSKKDRYKPKDEKHDIAKKQAGVLVIGTFFWVVLIILLAVVLAGIFGT